MAPLLRTYSPNASHLKNLREEESPCFGQRQIRNNSYDAFETFESCEVDFIQEEKERNCHLGDRLMGMKGSSGFSSAKKTKTSDEEGERTSTFFPLEKSDAPNSFLTHGTSGETWEQELAQTPKSKTSVENFQSARLGVKNGKTNEEKKTKGSRSNNEEDMLPVIVIQRAKTSTVAAAISFNKKKKEDALNTSITEEYEENQKAQKEAIGSFGEMGKPLFGETITRSNSSSGVQKPLWFLYEDKKDELEIQAENGLPNSQATMNSSMLERFKYILGKICQFHLN